jgi:hypothetical protein
MASRTTSESVGPLHQPIDNPRRAPATTPKENTVISAVLDAQPPADMPIWARLQLAAREVPFAHVDGWKPEIHRGAEIAIVFTIFGGVTTVTRPTAR